MKVTITFRNAQQGDVQFLLALRKRSMSEHLEKAGVSLSDEDHLARVHEFYEDSAIIMKDGEAIGLVKLGVMSNSLHIRQFQLLPECHNLGIGSKVLTLVKKKAIQLKLPITLNVLLDNPALSLYLRQGFVVTGDNELEYQMRWQADF
jgi:ribosomal protein S18 acetylase RimI-like enzyme